MRSFGSDGDAHGSYTPIEMVNDTVTGGLERHARPMNIATSTRTYGRYCYW